MSMLAQPLLIALGGAVGSVLRWGMATAVHAHLGRGFPYGTLAVNVLGCLLIGLLFAVITERLEAGSLWHAAIFIGLLGGFTTFSTFSLETLALLESGAWLRAAGNVVASLLLCLAATWAGLQIGRLD